MADTFHKQPLTPAKQNKRIARQKKAQAVTSLVGGTLGLSALATRGRGAQLARKGSAFAARAEKANRTSTTLTTAGAGIGGLGAYNFASYTNAEAKERKKGIRKMADGTEDPFGISKLGGPKARLQELTVYTQRGNKTTRHDADTVETHYKGKSLILRRPKYQVVAHPSGMEGKVKHGDYVSATPNVRVRGKYAKTIAEAHTKKSKTINLGGTKAKHVAKNSTMSAFGIDHSY